MAGERWSAVISLSIPSAEAAPVASAHISAEYHTSAETPSANSLVVTPLQAYARPAASATSDPL